MTSSSELLGLLRRMAGLDPAPWIMGGFAEDALLAGTVTRAHGDVDWLVPRRDLDLRLAQARELGFRDVETWGESAPGEPFYLFAQTGDLKLEIGVTDEDDGELYLRIHALRFEIDGREAPAGYRLRMPRDTYSHPPVELDGISIRVVSPLALYQLRAGIARQGSFGALSEQQLESMRLLRERFFPGRTEAELVPPTEPLR